MSEELWALPSVSEIIDIATFVTTVLGLFFIFFQIKQRKDIAQKQTTPLLGIEVVDAEDIRFNGTKFYKASTSERIPSPHFKISNHGGSPAIITALYRHWKSDDGKKEPTPINIDFLKQNTHTKISMYAIVGANRFSSAIQMKTAQFSQAPRVNRKRFIFQGLIEYEDVNGEEYLCGFSYVIVIDSKNVASPGFRMVFPKQDASKFNFNQSIRK